MLPVPINFAEVSKRTGGIRTSATSVSLALSTAESGYTTVESRPVYQIGVRHIPQPQKDVGKVKAKAGKAPHQ